MSIAQFEERVAECRDFLLLNGPWPDTLSAGWRSIKEWNASPTLQVSSLSLDTAEKWAYNLDNRVAQTVCLELKPWERSFDRHVCICLDSNICTRLPVCGSLNIVVVGISRTVTTSLKDRSESHSPRSQAKSMATKIYLRKMFCRTSCAKQKLLVYEFLIEIFMEILVGRIKC